MTLGGTAVPDADRSRKSFRVAFASIVLAALGLRIAAVLWIPTVPVSDFWMYLGRAESLARSGVLSPWPGVGGARLAPGYSLWLAAIFSFCRASALTGMLANCFLGAATVALGGSLSRELFGRWAALVGAGLLALDPRSILQACLLASENLSAPLAIAFLLLTARSWRRSRSGALALFAGLALGLAALTRPATRPLAILWPLAALLVGQKLWRVLRETGILAAALFAVLVPWGIWHVRTFGRWSVTTTTEGITLFVGTHPGASGLWMDWVSELHKERPGFHAANDAEMDRACGELALAWMRAHPFGALHLYAWKLRYFFWRLDPTSVAEWAIVGEAYAPPNPPSDVLPGPHVLKAHRGAVFLVLRFWYFGLLAAGIVAAVAGAARTLRRPTPFGLARLALVLGPCLLIPFSVSIFISIDRYRWPFEDQLAVLISALFASRFDPAGGSEARSLYSRK